MHYALGIFLLHCIFQQINFMLQNTLIWHSSFVMGINNLVNVFCYLCWISIGTKLTINYFHFIFLFLNIASFYKCKFHKNRNWQVISTHMLLNTLESSMKIVLDENYSTKIGSKNVLNVFCPLTFYYLLNISIHYKT